MHGAFIPETARFATAVTVEIAILLPVLITIRAPIVATVLITVPVLTTVLTTVWAEILPIWPVTPVEAIFAPVVAIVLIVVLIVPLVAPLRLVLVLWTIFEALRLIKGAWLMHRLGRRRQVWLTHHRPVVTTEIIALIVTEVVAIGIRPAHRCRTAHAGCVRVAATCAHLLFAEGHDDAIVVLGVLHIVLG